MCRYRPANEEQQLGIKALELFENEKEKAKQAIHEIMISPILDPVTDSIRHLRLGEPKIQVFLLQAIDASQYPDEFAIVLPYLAFGSLGHYRDERNLYIEEAKTVTV